MTWTEEKHNYHGNSNVSSAALSRMSWQREIFFYAKAEATKRWMSPSPTQHNGQNISEWVPCLYTSREKEWLYRSFIEAGMLRNTLSYSVLAENETTHQATKSQLMRTYVMFVPKKVLLFGYLSHTSKCMHVLYLKTKYQTKWHLFDSFKILHILRNSRLVPSDFCPTFSLTLIASAHFPVALGTLTVIASFSVLAGLRARAIL